MIHCYIDSVNNEPLTRVNDILVIVKRLPTFSIPLDSIKHITCPDELFYSYADGSFYVDLDDSSQNYAWISADNTSSSFFTHIFESGNVDGLGPGTYMVTAHGTNGCEYHDSVTIIQPEPWVDHIDEDIIDSIRCNQPAYVNLSLSGGTPPYTFNWEYEFDSTLVFPDTNELYFPLPGIYYSRFHDANGCLWKGVELTFLVIYELVVDSIHMVSHDTIICAGEEMVLSAQSIGTGNHTWYVGGNCDSVNYYTSVYSGVGYVAEYYIDTVKQPQCFKVTFVDQNGCETKDSVWVDVFYSNISMTIESQEIMADSMYTIQVSPSGGNLYMDDALIASNISSNYTFSTAGISAGEHVLRYAGVFGSEVGLSCEEEVSITIQVQVQSFVTAWDQEISIYPNPTTTVLNLSSTEMMDMTVSITDITGKVIMREKILDSFYPIDVSNLTSGIYLLRMETPEGASKAVKFVKR